MGINVILYMRAFYGNVYCFTAFKEFSKIVMAVLYFFFKQIVFSFSLMV